MKVAVADAMLRSREELYGGEIRVLSDVEDVHGDDGICKL